MRDEVLEACHARNGDRTASRGPAMGILVVSSPGGIGIEHSGIKGSGRPFFVRQDGAGALSVQGPPVEAVGASVLISTTLLFSSHTGTGAVLASRGRSWSALVPWEPQVGTGAVGACIQGHAVALSADGNTAIVGGNQDDNGHGAAWVYTRSGGARVLASKR
jgi:hypothetical protein